MKQFRKAAVIGLFAVVLSTLTAPLASFADTSTQGTINPDSGWTDTGGSVLQARGAGIFKVGATYYMVGEDKTAGSTFTAVACYSSTNLSTWTRQGNALSQQPTGDLAAGRIVERPKVIFNATSGLYVMYVHIDNTSYSDAKVGVATSTTPCGPYTYLGSSRPLGFQSRDIGLFQDTGGRGYLLTEDRANGLRIDLLSTDYTSVASSVAVLSSLEAPALINKDGRYFLFASHLTGWATNDNTYMTATSLAGPWTAPATFAPVGSKTHNSQTSFVLPVSGTSGTSYVYVGDRWNPSNLNASLPIWLPLNISGTTASMGFSESWSVDTATGAVATISSSLVGVGSGRCIDVPGGATANGTKVALWDCNTQENQQFLLTAAGELRVYGSSKCLDVFNNQTPPGSVVGIWDCTGGADQKWTFNANGSISSNASGLCLEVRNGKTANGSPIGTYMCTGTAWQRWQKG